MSQTYSNAKKIEVLFKDGKFDGTQQIKCVPAPFSLVKINGDLYLEPKSVLYSTEALAQFSSSDGEVAAQSRSGWFIDPNPVVMERHELGNLDADNWYAFHRFGDV